MAASLLTAKQKLAETERRRRAVAAATSPPPVIRHLSVLLSTYFQPPLSTPPYWPRGLRTCLRELLSRGTDAEWLAKPLGELIAPLDEELDKPTTHFISVETRGKIRDVLQAMFDGVITGQKLPVVRLASSDSDTATSATPKVAWPLALTCATDLVESPLYPTQLAPLFSHWLHQTLSAVLPPDARFNVKFRSSAPKPLQVLVVDIDAQEKASAALRAASEQMVTPHLKPIHLVEVTVAEPNTLGPVTEEGAITTTGARLLKGTLGGGS